MIGFLKRRRFRDVVARQLALFAADHGADVRQARAALAAHDRSSDERESLELYARFEDLSEDLEDALYDMCERYAQTLEEPLQRHYVGEFDRQARRQYRDVVPRLNFLWRWKTDAG